MEVSFPPTNLDFKVIGAIFLKAFKRVNLANFFVLFTCSEDSQAALLSVGVI